MRTLFSLVVVILVAAPCAAQTPELSIDLQGLGWGRLEAPEPIDTDGNPETLEWAISRWHQGDGFGALLERQWRVIAERGDAMCLGPWFTPAPNEPSAEFKIVRRGRVDKLRATIPTFLSSPVLRIFSLDTPPC